MGRRLLAGVMAAALSGCAWTGAQSPRAYDFSKVKRLSVTKFDGPGGKEATDAFIRHLIGRGLEITDALHPGDLVLSGAVTEYRTDKTAIIYLGKTSMVTRGGQTLDLLNPVVYLGPTDSPAEGTFVGVPKGQVTSPSAAASVTVALREPSNRRVLWSAAYGYEALDLPDALDAVAVALTNAFSKMTAVRTDS